MRKTILCLIAILCFSIPGSAQKKRDWIDGKVIDVKSEQKMETTPTQSGRDSMASGNSSGMPNITASARM